jgi:hypothetical protein
VTSVQGANWSVEEVDACVAAYFDHLALELTGQAFNKAQLYRRLSQITGRTPSSIEFKFQNISAVLNAMGREWMKGLAPLANYQELLAQKVSRHIERIDAIPLDLNAQIVETSFEEAAAFYLEAPPELREGAEKLPDYLSTLIRKFDPVERDMRNRLLGEAGEKHVMAHEKRFLTLIGRGDLAENVRWVSRDEGDGAGYDILSFTDRGDRKFIEVKTTLGGIRTPFFMSRNEFAFSTSNADDYNLVRLFDFRKGVRGFELRGRIDTHVKLSTETFRAEFQS